MILLRRLQATTMKPLRHACHLCLKKLGCGRQRARLVSNECNSLPICRIPENRPRRKFSRAKVVLVKDLGAQSAKALVAES